MDRVKRGIVLSASVLIAGFLFVLAQPAANTTAYQNSTNLQLNFAEMIRMNLSDGYQMRIAADGKPHFQSGALKVYLETNSYYGYDFFMETENPDLVNTADPTIKISNMKTANDLTNPDDTIPMNTWGLAIVKETGNFQDIFYANGSNLPLKKYTFMGRNTSDVAHDKLAVTIGAKIDDTIPNGTYTTSIRFTLVPRIVPNSIENIKYMQDVTSTVVSTMQRDVPYKLTDIRDNKNYYVAKDSSGKVMMLQNLDYDLSDGDTLGQMTSQINNSYQKVSNVGDHVSIDYNQAVYVSGNNIYRDNNGNETTNNEEPETAAEANNKAGGYYSYAAAIANTVNLYDSGGMFSTSLCPKNWRMPNRLEAQTFNTNSVANAWSNNNGYIGLDNNLVLNEGQFYWTAEIDKPNKQVNIYIPGNGLVDHFVDARTLASVRCQFNSIGQYKYKANLVYNESITDVKEYTLSGGTNTLSIFVRQDITDEENKIIGFSKSPTSGIPEYPITVFGLGTDYESCSNDATNVNRYCTDYIHITVTQSETTLYAVWSKKCNRDATTITEAVCMQDMNPAVRDSMEINEQYRLKDQRDGQKYWITKLSDNKVYMTQNLSYYTDVGKLHYYDESDVEEVVYNSPNASLEEGYYMKDGITKKSLSKQSDDLEEKHYNLGKYYKVDTIEKSLVCPARWHVANMTDAAIAAGIITDDSMVTSNPDNVGPDVAYDATLTNSKIFGAPLYLTVGGYRENDKSYSQGEKGKYQYGNKVFTIVTNDGKNTISPNENKDSNQYTQVRCVSDPKTMSDIEYMQEINNEIIEFTPKGTEVQLKDKRDEKKYWVTKDATGYVYMLQNLDLEIPETGITFYQDTTDMDTTVAAYQDTRDSMYIESAHSIKADNNNPEIIYAYDAGDFYIDEDRNVVSTEGLAEDAPELKEHVGTYYTSTAASIGRFEYGLFQTFTICPKNWTVESQKFSKTYAYSTGSTRNTYSSYTSGGVIYPTGIYTHKNNPALARKYAPVNANGEFMLRDVDTSTGSGIWGNSNNHYFNGDVNNIANDKGFVLHPVRCVIDLPFIQHVYHD